MRSLTETDKRILKRRALDGQHPESPAQIIAWFEAVAAYWDAAPTAFVWGGKRLGRDIGPAQHVELRSRQA